MSIIRSFTLSVERLDCLLLDAQSDLQKRNDLFDSGGNTNRLEANLRKKIEMISVELDSLVVLYHQQHQPSSPKANSKGAAIKRIEQSLEALERSCQFARQKSLVEVAHTGKPDLSRASDTELVMMQRRMRDGNVYAAQEKSIDTLTVSVQNLRVKGTEIGDELDVHMHLLTDLETNVDSKDSKMLRVTQKVEVLIENSSDTCLCLTIVALILLLVLIGVYL